MNNKVSLGEKVGYSMGDVAANLVFQMMMIYQLKFYTDIFGLDGAIAGTVLLVAPIVGALADPAVGLITDRTRTRWGKYRPWLLWTALPFSVFYFMAFHNPGITDKTLLAVYATISYVLLLSMYSFNNTPYASLGGVMTSNIRERTSITSIRFIASTIAQFVVQGLTLPLVDKFGGGNAEHGWTCTILLFSALAFICCITAFASTRERIAPPPQQEMSVRKDIKETFGCVPWRAMFVLTLFVYIALALWGTSTSFYFQSYVNQHSLSEFLRGMGFDTNERNAYSIGFSLFNIVNAVVQFLGVIFLSNYLSNKYGKKTVYIVGLSLTAVFTALFYIPNPGDVRIMYVLCFLKSLAYAPTIPLMWAMLGDVADYIEYANHRRATGFCFSGAICGLKTGLGLGGAFAGLILSVFGYVSGGTHIQSETAEEGVRLAASVIPAILFAIGVIALCCYPITKRFNENMQAELEARRKEQADISNS